MAHARVAMFFEAGRNDLLFENKLDRVAGAGQSEAKEAPGLRRVVLAMAMPLDQNGIVTMDDFTTSEIPSCIKAGYTNKIMADSRLYHDTQGSLHCGTNVRRILPALNWWEK